MSIKQKLLSIFLVLFIAGGVFAQGKIQVKVEGLRNTKGKVYVTIQNTEEMFRAKAAYYKVLSIDIVKGERSCLFEDIPEGTYAATILHDEDADKKLTTNFIGMPKEGFGFSNNAKGKMGRPSFEAAAFKVESGKTAVQKITFIYL